MKIQIPYQVILERFRDDAYTFEDKIRTIRATFLLKRIFRMPRQKVKLIFLEMKELKLIEFEEGHAGRILKLNCKDIED